MKLFSKNVGELLKLFYTNPEQQFYIQEIGRILLKKPGVFQRTLNNLEQDGILTSEYAGNVRYFRVNKDYPLYDELKSIIYKTVGITGSIKKIIPKIRNIEFCFIYGSFAKSQENVLSDIDLFLIGDVDEDLLVKEIDNLEKSLKRDINYKVFTESELKNEIANDNAFIVSVLEDKKIMIVGKDNELRNLVKK